MSSSVFNLTGLTCSACQKLISKRVMKINGVENVDVQLDGNTTIKANREILAEELKKALEGTQYKVI